MNAAKRPYNSQRRQSQARQTRRLILEAARELFNERGYSGATIEAIAQAAGVAPETIYAVFGNKFAVLAGLVDVTIVGDDEPVPLLQRPAILSAREETDQRRLIAKFAADIAQIMGRMSPMFALLRATAKTDGEAAALLERLLQGRRGGMSFFVEQLARCGPLRAELTADAAADTAWALSSAEVFDLLTHDRGWPREQYIAWLAETLTVLLLPPSEE